MNIDSLVRDTLHTRAGAAPPGADLLTGVRARSRRRRQRQLVVAAAAAVTLALTGPAVVWAVAAPDAPARPTPPPAASQPQPQPTGATTLVPAPDFDLPAFPFTPGWTPPGLSPPYYSFTDFGEEQPGLKSYHSSLYHYDPDMVQVNLMVDVSDQDTRQTLDKVLIESTFVDEDEPGATPPQELVEQAVTVQGRDAVLLSNDQQGVVSWQHEPDLWVTVWGSGAEEVRRYAGELAEEPFPARTPFTFALLPDGAELSTTRPGGMHFEPSVYTPGSENAVDVSLRSGAPGTPLRCPLAGDGASDPDTGECLLPREPIQVGGNDGELVGETLVVVYLDGGRMLSVEAGGTLSLSREDLVLFAAGVQVTPDAVPDL